jgi:OmcA/MtrC family decaheme c-type cytochrome
LNCAQDVTKAETGWCIPKSAIKIPTTATMVTGAMIGTFKQVSFTGVNAADGPGRVGLSTKYNLTNGTVSKGLVIKTPLKKLLATDPLKLLASSATGAGGNVARRVAVETDRCESCHEQLGTAVEFHGGARNDPTACAICHNTSRTSNGWSANASTFIHGIHAGTTPVAQKAANALAATVGAAGNGLGGAGPMNSDGKRNIPFSWARSSSWNAATVVYPGILKKCDNCHVRDAVNFGTAAAATAVPNMLWSTSAVNSVSTATATMGNLVNFDVAKDTVFAYPRDPVNGSATASYVTYIKADGTKNYGNVFAFIPQGSTQGKYIKSDGTAVLPALVTTPNGMTVEADPETLVESPMTSACFACHDSGNAKNHMKLNGGVIYGRRGDSVVNGRLENKESCLICHGKGRDYDSAVVHAK